VKYDKNIQIAEGVESSCVDEKTVRTATTTRSTIKLYDSCCGFLDVP
jgi:hypothetical protein